MYQVTSDGHFPLWAEAGDAPALLAMGGRGQFQAACRWEEAM